jgi:hypothetical protein
MNRSRSLNGSALRYSFAACLPEQQQCDETERLRDMVSHGASYERYEFRIS